MHFSSKHDNVASHQYFISIFDIFETDRDRLIATITPLIA
jgi:hypothetical protein